MPYEAIVGRHQSTLFSAHSAFLPYSVAQTGTKRSHTMRKLIVISAALAAVTLLSGCEHMVVHHGHRPVVVDNHYYHDYRDVPVIHHQEQHDYDQRSPAPRHTDKRVMVQKKVVVVAPPAHDRERRHTKLPSDEHGRPVLPVSKVVPAKKRVVVKQPAPGQGPRRDEHENRGKGKDSDEKGHPRREVERFH
jgi:hypothetical protein